MLLEADDEGRLVCDSEQLRVTIFGYHPKVSRALVEASIEDLTRAGLLKIYAKEGTRYAWFPSWKDHQRIDHNTPSKLPAYEDSLSVLENSRGLANPHVGSDLDLIGKDLKGSEGLTPPTREESRIEFKVNDEIRSALKQAPTLGAVPRLWSVEFWRAEIRANGELDMPAEILRAEAWMVANPGKAPRKDLPRFLHNWLARADRDVE
jgi:hypothetical protein